MTDKYKTSELSRMLASYLIIRKSDFCYIDTGEYGYDTDVVFDSTELSKVIDTFYEELP